MQQLVGNNLAGLDAQLETELREIQITPGLKDLKFYHAQMHSQAFSQLESASYAGITSGEFVQNVASGSLIRSPFAESPNFSQRPPKPAFSNDAISPEQLGQNHFKPTQSQMNVRHKFVYDLPQEFPFNEVRIRKSYSGSGDFTNSGGTCKAGSSQDIFPGRDVDPQEVL